MGIIILIQWLYHEVLYKYLYASWKLRSPSGGLLLLQLLLELCKLLQRNLLFLVQDLVNALYLFDLYRG